MAYTTIDNPADYFEVIAYAGDGNTTQAITANFQVDLSWIKHRSTTAAHTIQDSVRGFNAANKLSSNENDAENDSGGATWENYGHVSAVSSSSFTVTRGANTPYQTNASGVNYVAWHWKESATAGFDIVSYTGDGSASTTISHSLSAVPHWIIVKNRSEATSWCVTHKSLSTDKVLRLEGTNAEGDIGDGELDSPPASSSNFAFNNGTSGTPLKVVNESSDSYIAYLWTAKQGFSKFGSFVANSNTDGPFVYLGFRPALVIGKCASDTNDWFMFDNKRSTFNPVDDSLYPNTNAAENTNHIIDFFSNGFKIRDSDGTVNSTGNTYIYMAFAEAPFVNSKGVPANAR